MEKNIRQPTTFEALLPIIAMMVFIIAGIKYWDLEPHIPIVLACIVAVIIAMRIGYSWDSVISGILDSLGRANEALLIIMVVGMLIGSWVLAGTMPAMIY
ncbi:MAG: hypothetical protein GX219_06565 [Tissierellia bacterium]|nr:hypothetical protein [Tissierellia bacterium]